MGQLKPIEIARSYLHQGWMPLPVPFRSKNPAFKDWQKFRVSEAELPKYFNGEQQNIGVLLGQASSNLIDIDLDCDEAIVLAPSFLPATTAIFGRETRPRSHMLYVAPVDRKIAFTDPVTRTRLLEILTNGQQAIFPGSTHQESGETIRWHQLGEPTRIEASSLLRATQRLAAATVLARHWPQKGSRQDAALALAGGLSRAGWPTQEIANFIEALCEATRDEETMMRIKTASYSWSKFRAGAHVKGWPTLAEHIDDKVVKAVCKWLEIVKPERSEKPQAAAQTGLSDQPSLTPARWFEERFPSLSSEFGEATLEQIEKSGKLSVQDVNEDFLAATLSEKATPDAPTVFVPTESKFYTYLPAEGIFIHQRENVLAAQMSRLLLECARGCGDECDTRNLKFRHRDSGNLSGVLRKARGLLEATDDFFSSDLTEFLPCANGMLRLSDKAVFPFSPAYRRRNKLAVPFEATARCPLFLNTLMIPAVEPDELDLLQRWCGLALIGQNLSQKILILTGTAGGGKGTFVRVLNGIIGSTNLASLRPHLLGERFELGRFLGKTLLYGADVPENFLNQRGASVLKSLTGADPVTLEFKNSNESPQITCTFNVIVTCNSRLTVHLEGDTEAWRRRLAIVDYHRPKPNAVIADLDHLILRAEAPGVLNWMLEGLDKLRADDWQLHLTSEQQRLVDNLLLESDGHALFVQEELIRAEGAQLTVLDCFSAYVEYCSARGWVGLTRHKFGHVIGDVVARQYGITVRHDILDERGKEQRGWRGLRLREESPKGN
ncbi:MAG TPA: phage/plasmid primase, P4 family [Pyrinomonadaceae bacterium]|nr:phage/plasmid primase, P4 family [Pyrinomonadaceae bacterium]